MGLLYVNQKVVISDSEDETTEPSWEKQESMIRRLQRKFPDQDKEVKIHTRTHQTAMTKAKCKGCFSEAFP